MRREDLKLSSQNKKNMLIAALVGQIGVLTLIIVLAAGLGGIALDARLGTKPWFTIGLLVASIPISLLVMVTIARKTVTKIKETDVDGSDEEDAIGKKS